MNKINNINIQETKKRSAVALTMSLALALSFIMYAAIKVLNNLS